MYQLKNVNSKNIYAAIELGYNPMEKVFNRDDHNLPFFEAVARPEAHFGFCGFATESHIPGRHLNALLTAEKTIGIPVDPTVIEKHKNAAFYSFSGSVVFPLNRQTIDGELMNFYPHNLREGFHALHSLIKYRNCDKAQSIFKACLKAIFKYWDPKDGWNIETLEAHHNIKVYLGDNYLNGIARSLGPLMKYYQLTGDSQALELAFLLKEKMTRESFLSDGSYDNKRFTQHTHSVTCTMSSLAQMADILKDHELLLRVKSFYDNGLNEMRDYIGWSIESINQEDYPPGDLFRNPDRGEANNTGDIVETALILGRWGYSKYYEDAERILRCHPTAFTVEGYLFY